MRESDDAPWQLRWFALRVRATPHVCVRAGVFLMLLQKGKELTSPERGGGGGGGDWLVHRERS